MRLVANSNDPAAPFPPLAPTPIPSAVDPHAVERAWSMGPAGVRR